MLILILMTVLCGTMQVSFGYSKKSIGPVSSLMDELSFNTASITDEMALQLNNQVGRIGDILHGQVEVVLANAMDQMSEPLYAARQKLDSNTCQVMWTTADLTERIDQALRNCTQDLVDLTESFKVEAHSIVFEIEKHAQDILHLPSVCQLKSSNPRSAVVVIDGDGARTSFTSGTSCFVEQIADINAIVAEKLNRAKSLFAQTHQHARQSVDNSEVCVNDLVSEVISYLDESLQHC